MNQKPVDDKLFEIYKVLYPDTIETNLQNASPELIGQLQALNAHYQKKCLGLLPEKKPQVEGNKLPYINRGYIEGEVNGWNKAISEALANMEGE